MAATAITIVESPATIESDTSAATITKSTGLNQMSGVLVNGGTEDSYLAISLSSTAGTPTASDAQAQLKVRLSAGSSMPWLRHYASISHITASGNTFLYWFPNGVE